MITLSDIPRKWSRLAADREALVFEEHRSVRGGSSTNVSTGWRTPSGRSASDPASI